MNLMKGSGVRCSHDAQTYGNCNQGNENDHWFASSFMKRSLSKGNADNSEMEKSYELNS